ncbi:MULTISPECIES: hypothetical protein [unclassified Sphingomonas]|uniref:hypothetical protein n=1 Tax=Novosphingobium rhizosphaerae TaxID=1551649 RepID=UPI0015CAE47F
MKIALLFAALPLVGSPVAASSSTNIVEPPKVRTVCELKSMAARQQDGTETVSVTAFASYDFEHGYFLQDIGCSDPIDGTGSIQIKLPNDSRIEYFPELLKLSSQTWLASILGKKPRCTCLGVASFEHGRVTFTLKEAGAVWASD